MNRLKRLLTLLHLAVGFTAGAWTQSASDVLNGEFTINASGDKVQFSKGNLQKVNNVWQFAEHQYEYFGTNQTANSCDIFVYNSYTFPDDGIPWGILSQAEWEYLYTSRNVNNTLSSGARYSKAIIGGAYKGVIVFPDNYSHPSGADFSGNCNNATENYTSTVSLEGWAKMEAAGCVFLPAAGEGDVSNGSLNQVINVNDACVYYSTTRVQTNFVYAPGFYYDKIDLRRWSNIYSQGAPVRPVAVKTNLQKDGDGYFLLSSVQDWQEFAALTGIAPTANARMTADINLDNVQTKIATGDNIYYQGTFDGQGHSLTIAYVETNHLSQHVAPFIRIKNATIQNLHVKGSITTEGMRPAGITSYVTGTCYVRNCWSEVDITSSYIAYNRDIYAGGIVASVVEGPTLNMSDCLFTGSIALTDKDGFRAGGLIGWTYNKGIVNVQNCLFTPSGVTSTKVSDDNKMLVSGDQSKVTITNCYYRHVGSTSNWVAQGTQATAEQLANGTTATALQANRSETVWVQDPLTNQPMLALFAGKYKMPSSGLGTFSAKANFTLPEGLEAYYCKIYDASAGTISVVAINGVVPAETGVLLRGTAGETYTLTATNAAAAEVTDNALVAVTEQTTIQPTADGYTNFGLSGGVFKKVNEAGGTVKANRAYLHIPTTAGAREISLVWDEDVTAIGKEAIVKGAESSPGQWYTIGGRKLAGQPTQKGIYIVNGKKVVIK